jgi:hypothetical protein
VGTDNLTFTQFGAATTPAGANTQIQFNNSGAFGASANLTWDGSSLNVQEIKSITPTSSAALFDDTTSGNITIGGALTSGDITLGNVSSGGLIIKQLDTTYFAPPTFIANTSGDAVSLFDTTATGAITIGGGLTSGDLSLGKVGQTGRTKVLSNVFGSSTTTCALAVSGGIGCLTDSYFGGKITMDGGFALGLNTANELDLLHTGGGGSGSITNNVGDLTITNTAASVGVQAATTLTLFGGVTSNINIGHNLTTGNVVLGKSGSTNTVNINNSITMANKGAVTQITSDSTPVTLNASSGKITTVSLALSSHATTTFTVTNSFCAATNIVLANIIDYGGSGQLHCSIDNIGAGTFDIILTNSTGTTLDALAIIGFLII